MSSDVNTRPSSPPTPALPRGTKPLHNQAGGHVHGQGKTKYGMLEAADGALLKPVQSPPKGERELDFYTEVFAQQTPSMSVAQLRQFLPHFKGIYTPENDSKARYLILENITVSYREPIILDIKMGRRTYDPEASAQKIEEEKKKYLSKEKLGFHIVGLRAKQTITGDLKTYNKTYLKAITADDVVDKGFEVFLPKTFKGREFILRTILSKLQSVHEWFTSQKRFAFYSSSLLFVYDGAAVYSNNFKDICGDSDSQHRTYDLQNQEISGRYCDRIQNMSVSDIFKTNAEVLRRCEVDSPNVDVRMIDFAHVFESSQIDENYLEGLENLIRYFYSLI